MSATAPFAERRQRSPLAQVRWAILAAYEHRCAYCGQQATHIDHIDPYCDGGETRLENLIPACRWCNMKKRGHKLPDDMLRAAKETAAANADRIQGAITVNRTRRKLTPKTVPPETRKTIALWDDMWAQIDVVRDKEALKTETVTIRRLLTAALKLYDKGKLKV